MNKIMKFFCGAIFIALFALFTSCIINLHNGDKWHPESEPEGPLDREHRSEWMKDKAGL